MRTIGLFNSQEGFIVDIDAIQSHGLSMFCHNVCNLVHICSRTLGIGAVDITKLKTNGYYTIAVRTITALSTEITVHNPKTLTGLMPAFNERF